MKAAEMVDGIQKAPVTMNYGNFLQVTLDFLIVAFVIFMAITAMNRMKKEDVAVVPEVPVVVAQSKEEVLLAEIRDLLKGKK